MASKSWEMKRPLTEQELERIALELDDSGNNEQEDVFFGGEDSDDDPDYVEIEEDAVSEQSEEEDEMENEELPMKLKRLSILRGKNGYRWSSQVPEKRGRHHARNLVTHLPGPKIEARNVKSPMEVWNLLFTNVILDKIVTHTNEEIARRCNLLDNLQTYHTSTDILEIRSVIGLLYLCGVEKSTHLNLRKLWSNKFGISLFRAAMPMNRFDFLTSCLRFDDKETRHIRKETDKFAPIREIWELFISRCRELYTPREYCTIDEQLMGYRGKCSFRIYMASKPDKYGIKFLMLNDARTWYMLNAIPYTGKVSIDRESVPSYYVRKLSEPIHGTGRNLTVDNWFSSVELFDKMLTQYRLTMLGTIRKNKRELTPSFLIAKDPGTSKFAFDKNKTLVSFVPKKNKVVLLMSTMHFSDNVNEETGKPEIIMDYNSTKGGTDTFDKLCDTYTTARCTRRWPMRVFCGMLDHSGINAIVLFKLSNPSLKMSRSEFLHSLSYDLIEPLLRRRLETSTLRRGLRELIKDILQIDETVPVAPALDKKVRCGLCPRKNDRKTKKICTKCHTAICEEHRAVICNQCVDSYLDKFTISAKTGFSENECF